MHATIPATVCHPTGQLTSIRVDACQTKAYEWMSRLSGELRSWSSETDKTALGACSVLEWCKDQA